MHTHTHTHTHTHGSLSLNDWGLSADWSERRKRTAIPPPPPPPLQERNAHSSHVTLVLSEGGSSWKAQYVPVWLMCAFTFESSVLNQTSASAIFSSKHRAAVLLHCLHAFSRRFYPKRLKIVSANNSRNTQWQV